MPHSRKSSTTVVRLEWGEANEIPSDTEIVVFVTQHPRARSRARCIQRAAQKILGHDSPETCRIAVSVGGWSQSKLQRPGRRATRSMPTACLWPPCGTERRRRSLQAPTLASHYSAFVGGMNNLGDVVGYDTAFKTRFDLLGRERCRPVRAGDEAWYWNHGIANQPTRDKIVGTLGGDVPFLFAIPLLVEPSALQTTGRGLGPLSYGGLPHEHQTIR